MTSGNRKLNHALHLASSPRSATTPLGRVYYQRRIAEGDGCCG